MVPQPADTSHDTHARLLNAAGELFAEKGFDAVTVREICAQADANVAAVNYHFGDKLALYNAVVLSVVQFAEEAASCSREGPPEQQFREFISRYLQGLLGNSKRGWSTRVMQREMSNPTPALKHIVESVVSPTETRLRAIIGALVDLNPHEEVVRLCAHSVIGQCLHYKHAQPVFAHLWPDLWDEPERIPRLVDHIVRFSLGALHEMTGERRTKKV